MSCTKPGAKPDKPWQVRTANFSAWHFRSQRAAYKAVRETSWPKPAEIWHYEGGGWKLYERIEADQ